MARRGTAFAILVCLLVMKAAQWTTSSSPLGTAFVSGPHRQHDLPHKIQRRSLSDAQRAVLRLPSSDSNTKTGSARKADAGRTWTDAERNALRMPDAKEHARLIDESEYRLFFEKVLLQEESMFDGSAYGSAATAAYFFLVFCTAIGTYFMIWAYTLHMI